MIKEAYCSFEVSKLLKEKGFTWRTQYVYTLDGTGSTPPKIGNWRAKSNIQKPTQQMAMKWLRENYKLHFVISYNQGYEVSIMTIEDNPRCKCRSIVKNTYEEAVEAACLYALEKLI